MICKGIISYMFEALIQQALNWEGGVVFIPLSFGLAYYLCSTRRELKLRRYDMSFQDVRG
jgi:hypothetical protein